MQSDLSEIKNYFKSKFSTIQINEEQEFSSPEFLKLHEERVASDNWASSASTINQYRGTFGQLSARYIFQGEENPEQYGDNSIPVPESLSHNSLAHKFFGNMEMKTLSAPLSREYTIKLHFSLDEYEKNCNGDTSAIIKSKYSYHSPKYRSIFKKSKTNSLFAICHQYDPIQKLTSYSPLALAHINEDGELDENLLITF